jgi:hypothetical protein
MEQKLETKLTIKEKLNNFYNIHKVKIFFLLFIFIIFLIVAIFIQKKNKKNNILIAEKYVQANINLSLNKNIEATDLFDEIILSKNKFYSSLALNSIIEKKLVDNQDQILKYFGILESLDLNKEELDLIIFKKALYLIKSSKHSEGKKLLEKLIKKESKFKIIAEKTIAK